MQRLVTVRPHIYNGRILRAGDIYHATNAHAKVLTLIRNAKPAPRPPLRDAGLAPGAVAGPGPAAAVPVPPQPAAASPPEPPAAQPPKSAVEPGAVRASLLERAAALNIEVDPSWSNNKLRSEVDQVVRDRYRRRDLRPEK